MVLSPKVELRQGQQLVMTPQLQQAIKLLQFNNMELGEYVEGELEKNPLLEVLDPDAPQRGDSDGNTGSEDSSEQANATAEADGTRDTEIRDSVDLSSGEDIPATNDAPLDVADGDMFEADAPEVGPQNDFSDQGSNELSMSGTQMSSSGGSSDFAGNDFGIDQNIAEETSLADHLRGQLNVDVEDAVDRMIGIHLIDLVNEAGYLTGDIDAVAEMVGCPPEQVEATLNRLQKFDPPGVFARNLTECLALQLRDRNRLDPAMQACRQASGAG